ncbi:MAG: short-chain dehydrogenase/reductase [Solirubrobacterales bacterium]|nr:short-chain dehydrogenase/reductase [Solirubrobacterales bacterium]
MARATFDFAGSTAIVTGAARGIGLALSRAFADAGAEVVMVDADGDVLAPAAEAAGCHHVVADVTDSAQVDAAVARAVELTGRVDVLVNNAGVLRDKVVWKLEDEDWDIVVDVSLKGTFLFTRACVPHFRAQGRGRIVNVTSFTGLRGNVGQSAYAAAKSGVIGYTKTVAKELARFGVTVNAISPNAKTRMIDSIPEPKLAEIAALIPLGRFADPEEIAAGVLFLATDEAAYITGVVLPIDGGVSM